MAGQPLVAQIRELLLIQAVEELALYQQLVHQGRATKIS